MNKKRKVLITITYNEMGIIIDTKAEEIAQPNLQPTCNQLATDCISKQAAIDVLHGYFDGMLETDTWSPCDIYGLIEVLPSVQAERKKGKWIKKTTSALWYCSECDLPSMHDWPYCERCGADMRSDDK